MLDDIVTMDETMVSFHTPETKKQSKQWILKGKPGPLKAKVQASRTKQMVLAFFDSKGLIFTNIVPRGSTVNARYIVKGSPGVSTERSSPPPSGGGTSSAKNAFRSGVDMWKKLRKYIFL